VAEPYVMRQATAADLDTVLGILQERIEWLRDRGNEQWNQGKDFGECLEPRIARGQTWLAEDDGEPIATITIRRFANPAFWTPDERQDKALYATKTATTLARSGAGLAAMMLRWLQNRAAEREMTYLRWDVWRTNRQLQAYYQSLGATLVRTVEAEGIPSGALFQVQPMLHDLSSEWVTVFDEDRRKMLAERAEAVALAAAEEAASVEAAVEEAGTRVDAAHLVGAGVGSGPDGS
jgi:Rod binding domain-containing protein